jgi:hypothetical protein
MRLLAHTVGKTHLGESTIVPQIALVGEAVPNKSQLALLDVLLDGVEEFVFGDLGYGQRAIPPSWKARPDEPQASHWTIEGFPRSCSKWSVARWRTEGCHGRARWARHPFQDSNGIRWCVERRLFWLGTRRVACCTTCWTSEGQRQQ